MAGFGTFRVPARDRANTSIVRGLSGTTATLLKQIADLVDRALLVRVGWYNSSAASSISSVTFGASALTHIVTESVGADQVAYYYLVAPAVGIDTITVTFGSAFAGTADDNVCISAICETGIDQSTPIRASTGDNDVSGTTHAITLAGLTAGDKVYGGVKGWSGSIMRIHATPPDIHEASSDDSASDCHADASFVATGSSVTLNWDVSQDSGTQMVAVALAPAGGGGTAYELDAQPGSVTLTGVLAGVVAGRTLSAVPGSVALTGVAAGVAWQPAVQAAPGAYTLTGVAATLPAVRLLDAQPGALSLAGVVAGLAWQPALNAEVGVYTLTGIDATLEDDAAGGTAYELDAEPGAVTLTGVAAGVTWQAALTAEPAAYTLTGVAAGLALGAALNAATGTVSLTGSVAGLSYGPTLNAAPGTVMLTGVAASLPAAFVVAASPGAYTLTGSDAGLVASSDVTINWMVLTDVAVAFTALSGVAVAFPALVDVDVVTPEG